MRLWLNYLTSGCMPGIPGAVTMSITDLLTKGGPVVWILAVYSIIGLAIVFERYLLFLRNPKFPKTLVSKLGGWLDQHNAGSEIIDQQNPEARVISAVITAHRQGVKDLVAVANRIKAAELQRMEMGLRTLGVLGNTAPLLGLLGTITGMIKAFMVIELAGGKVDAQALAGGIWEAMVTTGVGLSVAIPLLILLHFLEGMVERRMLSIQHCTSLLLERWARPVESTSTSDDALLPQCEGVTDGL